MKSIVIRCDFHYADNNLYLAEQPKDCAQYKEKGDLDSRSRTIEPLGIEKFVTYCDQETEGGGWTTILNRDATQEVHEDFDKTYVEYENGFGDRSGEFWIGLQAIHKLTTFPCTELRIDMETYDGSEYVAKYSTFTVGSQVDGYVLTLGGFSSTPTFNDDFNRNHGMKFSTKDKDQDNAGGECASYYLGGWWYNGCFLAKFTGSHFDQSHQMGQGIHWDTLISDDDSMKKVSMKLRRKTNC